MEKILKRFLMVMMAVLAMSAMTACGGDDDEPANYAKAIAGTYIGEMTASGYVLDDTYIVEVTEISNTVVTVTAPLFSDGYARFNVTKNGSVYTLSTATQDNMTLTIQGKNMTFAFLNNAGTMTTFSGKRK